MSWEEIGKVAWPILKALIGLGVLGGIGTYIYRAGRKDESIRRIDSDLSDIKTDVGSIKSDIPTIYTKLEGLETSVDRLFQQFGRSFGSMMASNLGTSKSPFVLNKKGLQVLKESGIDKIIESRKNEIVLYVKEQNPENAYQVQEYVKDYVNSFQNDVPLLLQIEEGAFKSGVPVLSVLFVGAIHIRDYVLEKLGFNVDDIKDPEEKKKEPQKPKTKPRHSNTLS